MRPLQTRRSRRWQPSWQRVFGISARLFEQLATGARAAATDAADSAAKSQSRVEKVYRRSMSALVAVDDLREVAAKRELYRRLARTSDDLRKVSERVWYSVLKEG